MNVIQAKKCNTIYMKV